MAMHRRDVLGLAGVAGLAAGPWGARHARAAPVEVRVWGRTFRFQPVAAPDEPEGRPAAELVRALPQDLADAPAGSAPGDEAILAEVEERAWIAQFRYEEAFGALLDARARRDRRANRNVLEEEMAVAFRNGTGAAFSAEVQRRHDAHAALALLVGGLRGAMGQPGADGSTGHFTLPRFSRDVADRFRAQGFDVAAAYRAFRAVKAAYRSGEAALLARTVAFPLRVTGRRPATVRNAAQLRRVAGTVMQPAIARVVAEQRFEDLFVRDQGAMFGNGEAWLRPRGRLFGLGTVNPPDAGG